MEEHNFIGTYATYPVTSTFSNSRKTTLRVESDSKGTAHAKKAGLQTI